MTHLASLLRRLPLAIVLIATCATITESSVTGRERRHVGTEESSHRSGKEHASGTSGTTNNEITAEPGRKVSHHLIGGHLRVDTKSRRDGGEPLWDDGILMSAAGNGKEGKNVRGGGSGDDEDEKKTLSQQVKEGKYGLIQNEIYGERPNRPGIISYLGNPEVPKDTIDNLGGLDEEEIWLAENHVLVLKGGSFPEHEQDGQRTDGANWPPIDDYKAPQRQVKIPARPRIPPPFPVQLTDGGPIQIIGPNGTAENIGNGTLDHNADSLYTKGVLPGEEPFFAITPNRTVFTPDFGPPGLNLSVEEKSSRGNERKGVKSERQPPVAFPPFYHAIPPGAVFVPPPSNNQSDYDEEDQSIYYPPPYSFYYPQDNTTAVPPGPLVPGIILPPPPNFFSALDDKKTTTKKYTKRPPETTPSSPKSRPTYLPPRKVTTKQYKTSTVLPSSIIKVTPSSSISTKTSYDRATINATFTPKRTVEITTKAPGKPHTLENTEKYSISPVIGNQVSEATTQQKDWSTLTSKIPVLAYYPSTTQPSLQRHVEVTPASIKSIITTSQPGRSSSHASYYFYEEPADENSGVTTNPPSVYYGTTTTTTTKPPSYYNVEVSRPQQAEQKKHYYAVETIAPISETPKDYKVKLIDTIVKNSHTFQYTADDEVAKFHTGSSRDQGQRMLADQAPVFYQPPAPPPNHVPLQTYYASPKPQTYYRQSTKPKPIYQYSFQIADYPKHGSGNQGSLYHREQQQQQNAQYSEYQDVKSGNQQYDYEDVDSPRQSPPRKRVLYKTQHPVYSTSTAYPIVDTTSNPQHAYFTQQDEKLLDDVTKEYFTIFGKKLQDAGGSTTPIYGKSSSVVTEKPAHDVNSYAPNVYNPARPVGHKTPNVRVRYGDQSERPFSLKDDTLVNYRRPLPPLEPESEFIEVITPKLQPQSSPLPGYKLTEGYRVQNQRVQPHNRPTSRYRLPGTIQTTSGHTNNFVPLSDSREELEDVGEPASLYEDIDVNYRNPRPPINPDAEFIDPVAMQDNRSDNPNAYFAYRLPGDVGHFYFLTPQAITQRQDQNGGYVYPKPRGPRLRRRPGNV